MTSEITTTIKMPKETLIKIKSLAVEKGTSQKNIINELLNQALSMKENKNTKKIKAKIINDKLMKPQTKTKKYNSLKDMAGIIKLDHKTDSVELKNSVYKDKSGF